MSTTSRKTIGQMMIHPLLLLCFKLFYSVMHCHSTFGFRSFGDVVTDTQSHTDNTSAYQDGPSSDQNGCIEEKGEVNSLDAFSTNFPAVIQHWEDNDDDEEDPVDATPATIMRKFLSTHLHIFGIIFHFEKKSGIASLNE